MRVPRRRGAWRTDMSSAWRASQVEHEPPALRARHAQHDLVARLALAFGEERVAVVGRAAEESRDARAAHALRARAHDIHALLRQRPEGGFLGGHGAGL